MSAPMLTTLAVLIDAQNVPHTFADDIFHAVNTLGATSVRRIYGDWSNANSGGWKFQLDRHALRPMQQFNHVAGKEVADMALIIDAMDLLHSGKHASFCIVSSDSDFTGLAVRIRQEGIKVFGVGEAKAPRSFIASCDKFLLLKKAATARPAGVSATSKTPVIARVAPSKGDAKSLALPFKAPLNNSDLDILKQAITMRTGMDGWADVGAVGSYLAQNTEFSIRKHAASLSKLLRVSNIAEVAEAHEKAGTPLRVRLRSAR